MRLPGRRTGSPPRHGRAAVLVVLVLVLAGCRATDDGTRVRELDGAGEPLDEVPS